MSIPILADCYLKSTGLPLNVTFIELILLVYGFIWMGLMVSTLSRLIRW